MSGWLTATGTAAEVKDAGTEAWVQSNVAVDDVVTAAPEPTTALVDQRCEAFLGVHTQSLNDVYHRALRKRRTRRI
jgi:hypothetical protein